MATTSVAKTFLRVLYEYQYQDHEGSKIQIKPGDEYLLLNKVTPEWWYVVKNGERKPIYVPANYVEEIHKTVIKVEDPANPQAPSSAAAGQAISTTRKSTKGPAPAVPEKKKIPPKAPPKPSKLIRKPSVEEEVLKELDQILEHAFDGETIVEEDEINDETTNNGCDVGKTDLQDSDKLKGEKRKSGVDVFEENKRNSSASTKSNTDSVKGQSEDSNSEISDSTNKRKSIDIDSKRSSLVSDHSKRQSSQSLLSRDRTAEPPPDYDDGKDEAPSSLTRSSEFPVNPKESTMDSGISEGSSDGLDKKTEEQHSEGTVTDLEHNIPVEANSTAEDKEELPDYANFNFVRDTLPRSSQAEADDSELPDYANLTEIQAKIFAEPPPSEPPLGAEPVRTIAEWEEHKDLVTGRSYYFNLVARDTTWQPPSCFYKVGVPVPELPAESAPSVPEVIPPSKLPAGWSVAQTDEQGVYYVNQVTQEKWRGSVSPSGKTYFYNETTGESLWELPEQGDADSSAEQRNSVGSLSPSSSLPRTAKSHRAATEPDIFSGIRSGYKDRLTSLMTMQGGRRFSEAQGVTTASDMRGPMKRAKVQEHGKKISKTWSEVYAMLCAGKLIFYKNQKAALKSNKQEEVDLAGCIVEVVYHDDKGKARKNTLSLTTAYETEFWLQVDSDAGKSTWLQALQSQIHRPDGLVLVSPRAATPESTLDTSSLDRRNKKHATVHGECPDGTLDLADNEPFSPERATRIRSRLMRFLSRRPTADLLRERGIIKDGIFGNHLHRVCDRDRCNIPVFISKVITAIEHKDVGTSGIYRISGNMAEIQKLRFLIDSGASYNLESPNWDINVLTGALKLFFRELKEPLIPFIFFSKLLQANQVERSSRAKAFRELVRQMPPSNRETLALLMVHLNKVAEKSSENRMQSQNLAIVFGPTLMWPPDGDPDSPDVAVSMVQSGQIVEFMLIEQPKIFFNL